MRTGVYIDRRYHDIIKGLPKREFEKMAAAVFLYAFDGEVSEFEKKNLSAMLDIIKEDIDSKEAAAERKRRSRGKGCDGHGDRVCDGHSDRVCDKGVTVSGQEKKEKSPSVSLPPTPPISLSNPLEKKENSVSNSARTRKIPPSLEEVRAYCEQTGGLVDAEEWMAFYESKGWMVGKNKMTNWKSAVNTWNIARKKKLQAVTPKGYVYNYECGEDESL